MGSDPIPDPDLAQVLVVARGVARVPELDRRISLLAILYATAGSQARPSIDRVVAEEGVNLSELHHAAGMFEGKILGQLEALCRAVISTLRRRGLPIDAATEERIRAVDEINLAEWWLARASQVRQVEDVFNDRWLSAEVAGPTTHELVRHVRTLPRERRLDLVGAVLAAAVHDDIATDASLGQRLADAVRSARAALAVAAPPGADSR